MTPGIRNWKTTLTGVVIAIGLHLQQTGAKFPETKQEWGTLGVGVVIAVALYFSRDADKTSEQTGISRSQANMEAIRQEEMKTALRKQVDPAAHDLKLRKEALKSVEAAVEADDEAHPKGKKA